MGLPEISIKFIRKAKTFIKRSSRGMVLLILHDDTREQSLTAYEKWDEVEADDWTEKNYDYLRMVFLGEPRTVVAVRAEMKDDAADTAETIALFETLNYDWLAYPECTPEAASAIADYIKKARADKKKVKAVLPDTAADHEGIVNFAMTGISVVWEGSKEVKEYTTAEYAARIAGVLAGLTLSVSSTYYVLDEIVDLEMVKSPDKEIDAGKLVIIYDGEKYKIGRGVTSLTTVTEEQPEDFKKIKIVEGSDLIRTDIITTFEDEFVGKVPNTYDNKQVFIGAVNEYFKNLEGTVLNGSHENYIEVDAAANEAYLKSRGKDTGSMTIQQIREANTGSYLFVCGQVTMLDAMEDLQLNISM